VEDHVAVADLTDERVAGVLVACLIGLRGGQVGAAVGAAGDLHPVDLIRVAIPPSVDHDSPFCL
jgi:hypothetical protein